MTADDGGLCRSRLLSHARSRSQTRLERHPSDLAPPLSRRPFFLPSFLPSLRSLRSEEAASFVHQFPRINSPHLRRARQAEATSVEGRNPRRRLSIEGEGTERGGLSSSVGVVIDWKPVIRPLSRDKAKTSREESAFAGLALFFFFSPTFPPRRDRSLFSNALPLFTFLTSPLIDYRALTDTREIEYPDSGTPLVE